MSLVEQLQKAEQQIATDSYSMSVGELISSYRDGEIQIHPEFQRFFRWNGFQKTRLIESFLLGLPIPPIFVFQKPDGKWELIDGLQRVSTILEFVGELMQRDGQVVSPLVLTESKYLPDLRGVSWSKAAPASRSELPSELKLKFRKCRIDVKIILAKSDELSRFELFDRLNTGGSQATPQEVRNCLLLMKSTSFLQWLDELAQHPSFVETILLTDKQRQEQYNLELLIRFLVFQKTTDQEARRILDLETYLNERSVEMAGDDALDRDAAAEHFRATFDFLSGLYGDGAFRRPNERQPGSFKGPFLLAAYEIVALGVAFNLNTVQGKGVDWLKVKIDELWSRNLMVESIGLRASQRLALTLPLARQYLAE